MNYQSNIFTITLNNKSISDLVLSINYEDYESNKADTLKLKLFPSIKPNLKDEIEFKIDNTLIGKFYIASIAYNYKTNYELECTSIDYSSGFRIRKNRSFDKLSYKEILESIAKENNLIAKIDFKRMLEVVHIDQINQSDSNLCYHIAKELCLTQTIKNGYLIFLEKDSNKKPTITINANDCSSLSIQSYSKALYKSVEVLYQDTSTTQVKTIRVGRDDPTYKRHIHANNDDEAYKKAESILKTINSNKRKGNLESTGKIIHAGSVLEINGDKETSGKYLINKVSHSIDNSGWKTSVEFG